MERCPVCRARRSDNAICHRCGADLTLPVKIAAQAAAWEHYALTKIANDDLEAARQALANALALKRNPSTLALAELLNQCRHERIKNPASTECHY